MRIRFAPGHVRDREIFRPRPIRRPPATRTARRPRTGATTASTARTAMANPCGTSFSAVSAAHASRNAAPRIATPATTTAASGVTFSRVDCSVSPYEMNSPTHGTVKTSVRATATSGWRRFTPLPTLSHLHFSTGAKHLSRLFCRHGQTTSKETEPATLRATPAELVALHRLRVAVAEHAHPAGLLAQRHGRYDLRPD